MRFKLHDVDRVHFLQPYAYDLLIGREYNDAIDRLPGGSWICINDQDTLKPPGYAERVKYIIEYEVKDPETYLIGSRTNRMSRLNPNVVPELHEEGDISKHLVKAFELWEKHRTSLTAAHEVAGYCMIFNKALWEKVGGFPPRSIRFDSWLSERAEIYTALGLYTFHLYRWHKRSDPERAYSHLLRAGSQCRDPYR